MFEWWLLANVEAFRAAARYMQRSASLSESWFTIAAVAAIIQFWLALVYWDRYRKQPVRQEDRPKSLFLELCRAHKLSRAERGLLSSIVDAKHLKQPAIVFVDPGVLGDPAGSSAPETRACAELAGKLFGLTNADTPQDWQGVMPAEKR